MEKKAADLPKSFDHLDNEAKESISKLQELVNKFSMKTADVLALLDNKMQADTMHPELESIEGMTASEFASHYKQMSEDIKADPQSYERHAKVSGMSPDDLSVLFAQINGVVEKYPEVWTSQEEAHALSPKNLSLLIKVFKK